METNPHERELREIFRLARIDYGKIDYAVLGDRLQVWEINTNPTLAPTPDRIVAERRAVLSQRVERIAAAFAEIDVHDDTYPPEPPVSLSLSSRPSPR